ncbi:MAG: hypothetical protein EZS28_013758 [Streblomastix strix]|uniref:Uncharacterized protein n=1 Tax=Streblomastix strix TaxID=222440 RepID=A0A5J4W798_9EUKA|nr:MAG: hypothetical protein EZS28_013758 [Streblomastix strix]
MTESKKRTVSDQNADVQQSVKEERLDDDFYDDYDQAAELFVPDSSFTADILDKDIFRQLVSTTPTQQYKKDEYNDKNESSAEIETDGDSDQYINDESDEDYVPVNERQRKNINQYELKSEQDEDDKEKKLKILQRIVEPEVLKANYLTIEDQILQDIPIPERLLLIHTRKRMSLEEGRLHLEDKFRLEITPIMEEAEWIVRHFYTPFCPYPKAQSPNYLIKSKGKIVESKQEQEFQQRIFQEKKRCYSKVAEKATAKIHKVLSIMLNEKKKADYLLSSI